MPQTIPYVQWGQQTERNTGRNSSEGGSETADVNATFYTRQSKKKKWKISEIITWLMTMFLTVWPSFQWPSSWPKTARISWLLHPCFLCCKNVRQLGHGNRKDCRKTQNLIYLIRFECQAAVRGRWHISCVNMSISYCWGRKKKIERKKCGKTNHITWLLLAARM